MPTLVKTKENTQMKQNETNKKIIEKNKNKKTKY